MKYVYTVVYRVKGIVLTDDTPLVLVNDEARGIHACIVKNVTPHIAEVDRCIAVANLMLNGLIGEKSRGDLSERLATELVRIRETRAVEYGRGPFITITATGETGEFQSPTSRETEDFIFEINGAPKAEIVAAATPLISSLVSAVILEAERVIGVDEVTKAVVFFRSDGKPIYSYTFSASATGFVSSPLPQGAEDEIARWYSQISSQVPLGRVVRLLVDSLKADPDPLRAFLAAWNALEILTNKIFPGYEATFFADLAGDRSEVRQRQLGRIRKVMEGKYSIADKLAVISLQLSPETSNADLMAYLDCKKQRDDLAHGQDVDEKSLKVQSVRNMTRKFLRLHLNTASRI